MKKKTGIKNRTDLALWLCKAEKGKSQVDVAQMREIVRRLSNKMKKDTSVIVALLK